MTIVRYFLLLFSTIWSIVSPDQPLLCPTTKMGNVDASSICEGSSKPGPNRVDSVQSCYLSADPRMVWNLASLSSLMVTPTVLLEFDQDSRDLQRGCTNRIKKKVEKLLDLARQADHCMMR